VREADNLPPYSADVKKSRSLNSPRPSGPAWPVMGVLYLYLQPDRKSVFVFSGPGYYLNYFLSQFRA
jgi:hypothetical protein